MKSPILKDIFLPHFESLKHKYRSSVICPTCFIRRSSPNTNSKEHCMCIKQKQNISSQSFFRNLLHFYTPFRYLCGEGNQFTVQWNQKPRNICICGLAHTWAKGVLVSFKISFPRAMPAILTKYSKTSSWSKTQARCTTDRPVNISFPLLSLESFSALSVGIFNYETEVHFGIPIKTRMIIWSFHPNLLILLWP